MGALQLIHHPTIPEILQFSQSLMKISKFSDPWSKDFSKLTHSDEDLHDGHEAYTNRKF